MMCLLSIVLSIKELFFLREEKIVEFKSQRYAKKWNIMDLSNWRGNYKVDEHRNQSLL